MDGPEPHPAWTAARESAALFRRPDDSLIAVTGSERGDYLNKLVTSKVDDLGPGEGVRAFLLNPTKGRVLAEFLVIEDEPTTWLECRGGSAGAVLPLLEKYYFGQDVAFEHREGADRIVSLVGPASDRILERAGAEPPEDEPGAHRETTIGAAPVRVVRWSDTGLPGCRIWLEAGIADEAVRILREAGAVPGDPDVWTLLQIEGGIAAYGRELTESTIPLEAPTADAIDHAKGCYPGQEVIARLWARGRPARELRGLVFDAAPPPPAGIVLDADEKSGVATLTASGISPELGPVALAYVHRDYLEPGTRLAWDGGEARVTGLPIAASRGAARG